MQTGEDILFTAPGPDPIPTATTEIVGTPGNGFNVYWIVSHFPIGSVVSGPFPQKDSPNVLDFENFIHISWLPTPGALSYDLLVTKDLFLPKQPGRFLLEVNLTETEFRDTGQGLSFYDLAGIPLGAPQEEHIYFDNRDFKQPTLRFIPWPIQVSSIIFEDGTSMSTAGGGGGAGNPAPPNQSVQFNDNGIFGGSPYLIFNQADFPPLGRLQAINPFAQIVASFSTFGLQFTGVPSFAFIDLTTTGSWNMRSDGDTEINTGGALFVTTGFNLDMRISGATSLASGGPITIASADHFGIDVFDSGFSTGFSMDNSSGYRAIEFVLQSTQVLRVTPITGASGGPLRFNIPNLPTSSVGLDPGDLWNNGGVLNIV